MPQRGPVSNGAIACAAAALALVLAHDPVYAQGQKAPPAQGQKSAPPPAQPPVPQTAPPKPYKPVPVTIPAATSDPSLDAFRKEIAAVAQRKDRAALAKMVVAKGFFWERDDDKPAPKKSGIDILAQALRLSAKDGSGWAALAGLAGEANAAPVPERKDLVCAPAAPAFDEREVEELAETTETDLTEWGYPLRDGIEVRETPSASAPAIEKLGLHLVRVLDDDSQATANTAGEWLRVVAPSGKVGFVTGDALGSLLTTQICYVKEGNAWKITGLVGGGE
jgi:hypothetical protein